MNILKQQAAKAALDYIQDDIIVGVGSGSTVNYFIEELRTIQHRIAGCVASSVQSELRLQAAGIPVFDLNVVNSVPIYIDGADEVNSNFEMIKGGGGALTREKIIATVAECFICIVDETKVVANLGQFPIAVEVLPIARSFVARKLLKLGGDPAYRQGFITDNQNIILDVSNLEIDNIIELEEKIKAIPGVVESGLFGKRKADCILIGHANGCTKKTLT